MATFRRRIRIQTEVGVLHRTIDAAGIRHAEYIGEAEVFAAAAELVEQRRGKGRDDASTATHEVANGFTLGRG